MNNFSVTEWVALFKEIGLTDAQMHKWHQLFEQRYPEVHQSFLQWLGLSAERIKEIRNKYSA